MNKVAKSHENMMCRTLKLLFFVALSQDSRKTNVASRFSDDDDDLLSSPVYSRPAQAVSAPQVTRARTLRIREPL